MLSLLYLGNLTGIHQTPDVYSIPLGGGGAAGPSMIGHNQQTQQTQVAKLLSGSTLYLLHVGLWLHRTTWRGWGCRIFNDWS